MADSAWDMWSAIGTIAAVFVALGISVYSELTSRIVEKDRAELAAAKMLSPLSALERKASYLVTIIGFRTVATAEPEPIFLKCLDDLEELSNTIEIDDLYPLLKLPNHSAKRASRSLGLIQTFIADARPVLLHPSWTDKLENRSQHYQRWSNMLSEISDLLIVAVRSCEAAASIGAPIPSREEIQGDQ